MYNILYIIYYKIYYFQHFPKCFGAYCSFLRENFVVRLKYCYVVSLQILSCIVHGLTNLLTII